MTTDTKTTQQIQLDTDRLWNCYLSIATDFQAFAIAVNKAQAASNLIDNCITRQLDGNAEIMARLFLADALKRLDAIESSIKRYREGRPQSYQEG